MDNSKRLISTLFLLIMLIILLSGMTCTACGQNLYGYTQKDDIDLTYGPWTYRISDDHAILVSYTGDSEILVIPDYLGGKPVTDLYDEVFENNRTVKELTVSENVKYISPYALRNSAIKKVTLNCNLDPDRLASSNLLPDSVVRLVLGRAVEILPFYKTYWVDGNKLQKYETDANNPFYIAVDGILYSKDMTKLIRFPEDNRSNVIIVPDGVKEIGTAAFSQAFYMTEIHIPDSVVTFGDNALGASDYSSSRNKIVLYASEGSAAEAYAISEQIPLGKKYSAVDLKKANAERTVKSADTLSYWNGMDSEAVIPVGNNYYIRSAEQLKWLSNATAAGRSFVNCNIILTADIDLNDKVWTPIGAGKTPFRGNFDGQGHTISNLNLNGDSEYNGLFGLVRTPTNSSITIKNVNIENVSKTTTGGGTTGALIGDLWNWRGGKITVSGCRVSGVIRGSGVGGVIGNIWTGQLNTTVSIKDISSTVRVSMTGGTYSFGGGVIAQIDLQDYNNEGGFNGKITVEDCNYKGRLTTEGRWGTGGGIVGRIVDSTPAVSVLIKHCRAEGEVSAGSAAVGGGIISSLPAGQKVVSCVSKTDVYGYNTGCITSGNDGVIEECYAKGSAGAKIGGQNGGITAYNNGRIFNSCNAASAPNSSALVYNGNIAASGNGTVENTL